MVSEDEDEISFDGGDIAIQLIEEDSFSENDNQADEDFEPLDMTDSDFDDEDIDANENDDSSDNNAGDSGGISTRNPTEPRNDNPIEEDEDDVIKAIVAATKATRTHPPDITTEDFVIDLSFHPDEDILAAGTITGNMKKWKKKIKFSFKTNWFSFFFFISGDILVYKYCNEENILLNTLEVHNKSIRTIEFGLDGKTIYSSSRDKSIILTDTETGKFKRNYENAHESPVYRMNVFSENLFATGKKDFFFFYISKFWSYLISVYIKAMMMELLNYGIYGKKIVIQYFH